MAYFSNGCEGETLDNQCCDCPLGELPCPTTLVQLTFNYDQCSNEKLKEAMTMLVDDDGICQTRKLLEKIRITST